MLICFNGRAQKCLSSSSIEYSLCVLFSVIILIYWACLFYLIVFLIVTLASFCFKKTSFLWTEKLLFFPISLYMGIRCFIFCFVFQAFILQITNTAQDLFQPTSHKHCILCSKLPVQSCLILFLTTSRKSFVSVLEFWG